MNKDAVRRTRLVCGILVGLAAIVTGVCFITASLGIYLSGGEQIYTPEKVAHGFSVIAVPVYIFLALAVLGMVLDFFLPLGKNKLKAEKNPAATLERLLGKRDIENCDAALKEQILAQRTFRRREKIITLAVLAVCSVIFLCYGCNGANFHQSQINASMAKAVLILLCCMVIPFALAVVTGYRSKKSLQKEIELVKQIPAGEAVIPTPKAERKNLLVIARWVLVGLAVAILIYGFFAGGTADVLTKAKNICTECVGLG